MNTFEQKLHQHGQYPLKAIDIRTLQVNIGYKCNLSCTHCHVEASPDRKELMSLSTMSKILKILRENDEIDTIDITGGSPEFNPYFKYLVKSCADIGKQIIIRTNLAIYSEPDMKDIPEFLADNRVKITASLPCYSEEGVDSQRGKGTYKKAIGALLKLNSLGYGTNCLTLDLMFNPSGAATAPDQKMLEEAYREKLKEMHNISFSNLIALSNMPIGRLGKSISDGENFEYIKMLSDKFNPETLDNIMCRHLINISPDGSLFDCDFWQMLNMPLKTDCSHLNDFDYAALSNREIVTAPLCYMCTAGAGASCSGAIV
jgi:radical SAM/Cys-rich protein